MSSKAMQLAKDLDHARCKGQWQNIPELARRYKKYSNDASALEQAVLAETSLESMINSHVNASDSTIYSQDAPHTATLRPRLQPKQVKALLEQLHAVDGSLLDVKVITTRCYFESGDYELTLRNLDPLPLDDKASGYSWILQLQAMVIKAVSLESTNDIPKAIIAYQDLTAYLEKASVTTDRVLVDWAEEGLYRGSLLFLNQRQAANLSTILILQTLRLYQNFTSSQPTHWRIHKREIISKYSLDFLSYCYQHEDYAPPPLGDTSVQMSPAEYEAYKQDMFVSEMTQLYSVYEKLVYGLVSFPSAGQTNVVLLDLVDRMAEDLEMIGNPPTELRSFLETLNRATQRTFNSSKITRHLFNTLYLLGEFKEADHALSSYLYLVGLQSQATKDAQHLGQAVILDPTGKLTPLPMPDKALLKQLADDAIPDTPVQATHHRPSFPGENISAAPSAPDTRHRRRPSTIAARRTDDKESVEDILHVLLRGIRMYDKYLDKSVHAVELADLAKIVLQAAGVQASGRPLAARVYRNLGAAYGVLARHTVDPDQRPIYHEMAIQYLQESLTLNDRSWETYYQLGKQYADMRNINDALKAVVRSLELNAKYIPAWHLLVLLYSCPGQDNVTKALQTCELGLQEARRHDDTEDYVHLLMLKLTHIRLVALVHGNDKALTCQEELFTLYGRLALMDPDIDSPHGGSIAQTSADNAAAASNGLHASQATFQRDLVVSGSLGNLAESSSNGTSSSLLADGSTSSLHRLQQRRPKHHLAMILSSHHYQSAKANSKKGTYKLKGLLRKRKSHSKLSIGESGNGSKASFHSGSLSVASNKSIYDTEALAGHTTFTFIQRKRMRHVLCLLWIQAADLFLDQDRLDEALKAIEEAEKVNWTTESRVWCALGKVHLRLSQYEDATDAFRKGMVADALDLDCRLWLAKSYMERNQLAMAEGILDTITQGTGWDCTEAWFRLGDIYGQTQRLQQSKNYLFYALELDETQPIQPFTLLPTCT
ncbi:hypothetical protein DM01DRAFT_1338707 [Hesseltinella vesiculosa]|uniref:TPR-like protein n=1 Tax=Hesseltinella vesiculosa TaxID=101127 RepID=A0A1X2G949_9FUNG|nr:hypothetical protein DM01DRAFT_1338707 [Hesseltinella vesiculosa]